MFYLNGHSPVLVIDPDTQFLDSLVHQPYASLAPPITARSHDVARELLTDTSKVFSGIFINLRMTEIEVVSLMHTIHQLHVGTPTFALFDYDTPATFTRQMRKLGLHDSLHKPLNFGTLMATIAPLTQEELNLTTKNSNLNSNSEFAALDFEFTPINIIHLMNGTKCLFDIYESISPGRYTKKSSAGASMAAERLQNCLERDISQLFILKQDQQAYINHCENLLAELSRKSRTTTLREASDSVLLRQEQL